MVTLNRDEGGVAVPILTHPKPISCCDEELVEVELEALRQGAEQARRDGIHYLATMEAVRKAATVACDHSLEVLYLPLDERKYREVFILAWCAGYRAEARQYGLALNG